LGVSEASGPVVWDRAPDDNGNTLREDTRPSKVRTPQEDRNKNNRRRNTPRHRKESIWPATRTAKSPSFLECFS